MCQHLVVKILPKFQILLVKLVTNPCAMHVSMCHYTYKLKGHLDAI
jgi:hypothetical protein